MDHVRKGAGSDSRIGLRFFFPGVGYGGSCFPKDVRALGTTAKQAGMDLEILEAVESVNREQKKFLAQKVFKRFGADLSNRRFAVWGLSFKPQTDDMREAPSIVIIRMLQEAGATIVAYDPEAMDEARQVFGDSIEYASSAMGATDGCDGLLLITEWNEFRTPRWADLYHRMAEAVVFDGRNIYPRDKLQEAGFEYHCVGRG